MFMIKLHRNLKILNVSTAHHAMSLKLDLSFSQWFFVMSSQAEIPVCLLQ